MSNYSNESEDHRAIARVISEKAMFGAVPLTYRLHNDDRLHPVQFTKHPELQSIQFSDGTVSIVSQPPTPVLKDREVDRDPEVNRAEDAAALNIPPLSTRLFTMDLPETVTEDMTSDLNQVVTEVVTEEATKVDDGMYATESDRAEAQAVARKFAPDYPKEDVNQRQESPYLQGRNKK